MSKHTQCDPTRLKAVIAGSLDPGAEHAIEQHLESCTSCRKHLEQLAAEPQIWNSLSDYFSEELFSADCFDGPPTVNIQLGKEKSGTDYSVIEPSDSKREAISYLQEASHPELLGRLDGFDVERVIGSGGMGVVYKGFDTELNRPVAIKVLADHLATNGVARKRFAREARAAAAVIHPNVVPIHSVNSNADRPYIVMTLVSGRSLQAHIAEDGPLQVKDIVRIAKQIASGLSAAHKQGLVHRDIKPANILLEKDVSRVMITDFGLARAADDAAITQTGWLAGTPNYMSPEQANGLEVDQRSDLFSLGSVIYFMATGREPFRAEIPVAVLKKITSDRPAPVRSVNSDVTKTLAKIIERLMAKAPEQRFQSAAEVEQVLTKYLAHLEQPRLKAKPKIQAVRKIGWVRVALCLGTLLAFVVAYWNWPLGEKPVGPDKPQTDFELQSMVEWQDELNALELEILDLETAGYSHAKANGWSADGAPLDADLLRNDIEKMELILDTTSIGE